MAGRNLLSLCLRAAVGKLTLAQGRRKSGLDHLSFAPALLPYTKSATRLQQLPLPRKTN